MKNRISQLFLRTPRLMLYGATLALQFFLVSSQNASAAAAVNLPSVDVSGGDLVTVVFNLMCSVAGWLFYILAALVVIFVLVAAYKYLTSAGDPAKVSSATKTITFAAVAIVVALFAKVFPLIVSDFFTSDSIPACL